MFLQIIHKFLLSDDTMAAVSESVLMLVETVLVSMSLTRPLHGLGWDMSEVQLAGPGHLLSAHPKLCHSRLSSRFNALFVVQLRKIIHAW